MIHVSSCIYSKPVLYNAKCAIVSCVRQSCNACKSGKLTFFNTAIYMNDMTCTNEMQHGLLEQNTRFKHSSVIFTNILLAN